MTITTIVLVTLLIIMIIRSVAITGTEDHVCCDSSAVNGAETALEDDVTGGDGANGGQEQAAPAQDALAFHISTAFQGMSKVGLSLSMLLMSVCIQL